MNHTCHALRVVGLHLGRSQSTGVNCKAVIRRTAHRDDTIRSHFIGTAPSGSRPRSYGFWHRTKQYQVGRTPPLKSRGMTATIQIIIACLPVRYLTTLSSCKMLGHVVFRFYAISLSIYLKFSSPKACVLQSGLLFCSSPLFLHVFLAGSVILINLMTINS